MKKSFWVVLIVAFLFRLIALNQSLWLDEATTAQAILHHSYLGIIFRFSPFDFHPPLYYIFMKFWATIFGYSAISLRLPSVIFSIIAGWIIYGIGSLLIDKRIGLWAAIFFLFNPLVMYYSQEARMYMMTTFLLAGATYYFIKILQTQKVKIKNQTYRLKIKTNLLLFSTFTVLSFYTFYGSIFYIIVMFLILAWRRTYKEFMQSAGLFVLLVIPLLPLIATQFSHSRVALSSVTNWPRALGQANLKNLLLFPVKFTSGRISFDPKKIYYAIAGMWTVMCGVLVLKAFNKKNGILVILLSGPLVLGLIFSVFSPLLQYFRFLYLAIPLSILFALGTRSTASKGLLLVGLALFSMAYVLLPQFHREDWKIMSLHIPRNDPIYMIPSSSDPLLYYLPMVKSRIFDLRTLQGVEIQKRITVIPYTADIYGFDYKTALENKGFSLQETRYFRGLEFEIWVRNKAYAATLKIDGVFLPKM